MQTEQGVRRICQNSLGDIGRVSEPLCYPQNVGNPLGALKIQWQIMVDSTYSAKV